MPDPSTANYRQMIYWRLISAAGGLGEPGAMLEKMAAELADRLELPSAILDPSIGVDVLLHRYPKLIPHFDAVQRCVRQPDGEEPASPEAGATLPGAILDEDIDLRRAFAFSKLLLNVFGPNTRSPS